MDGANTEAAAHALGYWPRSHAILRPVDGVLSIMAVRSTARYALAFPPGGVRGSSVDSAPIRMQPRRSFSWPC